MSILTSQKIRTYYESYKNIEITFTKDVLKTIALNSRDIFLKCLGDQWNCVIYSCSMSGAKIIANLNEKQFEKIRKANNMLSLRFSFKSEGKADNLNFFVPAKVTGFNPYSKDKPTFNFVSLNFTQQPPDDLIIILGKLLDANVNSKKRKEERIQLTVDNIKRLNLVSKDAIAYIDKLPRKCIIRDISFSGAKIVIFGIAKFLVDKPVVLNLQFNENKQFNIPGKILRFEAVEGRKDLGAVAIHFSENAIPIEYKMHINDYYNQKNVSPKKQ